MENIVLSMVSQSQMGIVEQEFSALAELLMKMETQVNWVDRLTFAHSVTSVLHKLLFQHLVRLESLQTGLEVLA